KTVASVPDAGTFTYAETGSDATATSSYYFDTRPIDDLASENDARVDGLAISKVQQPEAFPVLNRVTIGRRDADILRIARLRDSLLVFSEAPVGLWRLSSDLA